VYALAICEGVVENTLESVKDTAHLVLHPFEALNNIANMLVTFGPPAPPDSDTASEWELYEQQCQQASENRAAAAQALKKQWHDSTNVERVRSISGGIASLVSGAVTANIAGKFISATARLAKNEVAKFGKAVLDKLSKAELATTAPGYLLIKQTGDMSRVVASGQKIGYSHDIIKKFISGAEKQGIELETLAKILEYEHLEVQKLSQRVEQIKPRLSLEKPISNYKKIKEIIEYSKLDKITCEKWEKIRLSNDDIHKIALHTGIKKSIIEAVKKHLFYLEHTRMSTLQRFDPCADILDTWNRLTNGNFGVFDLELLQHKYYESILMNIGKLEYEAAHAVTMQFFPWHP